MEQYSVQEAQGGKTVLIVDQYAHTVQLVPVSVSAKRRKAGSAKGEISMAADFDSPLADFSDYLA